MGARGGRDARGILTYELVHEQYDCDDVEHEQIEYVLSVFFQVSDDTVDTTFDLSFVFVHRLVDVETGHSVVKLN